MCLACGGGFTREEAGTGSPFPQLLNRLEFNADLVGAGLPANGPNHVPKTMPWNKIDSAEEP
ncbi:hypothetical protein D3C80_2230340 [compost metagenome]